jgi:hypothetical protein
MENRIGKKMFESLVIEKYESESMLKLRQHYMVYMENAVGIGEHPQHLKEMDNFVEKLANASDKLQTIKQF